MNKLIIDIKQRIVPFVGKNFNNLIELFILFIGVLAFSNFIEREDEYPSNWKALPLSIVTAASFIAYAILRKNKN